MEGASTHPFALLENGCHSRHRDVTALSMTRPSPLASASKLTLVALLLALPLACSKGAPTDGAEAGSAAKAITIYSGRAEPLVAPVLERFQKETGITVKVRYGDTAALTALLLEERERSPAVLFFAQDAGALGALESKDLLAPLPADLLVRVGPAYRAPSGQWVGISGRVRTLVYNTDKVKPEELPGSILELADEKWAGRVGWAPTNGSFQAFVTGVRLLHGDELAGEWLMAMNKYGAKDYPKNGAIVQAVGAGEIDVGLVNHYYLHRALAEDPGFPARNHYAAPKDAGALVNVSGLALLRHAEGPEREAAVKLASYLLSPEAQSYFAKETFEYPLARDVSGPEGLPALETLRPPELDLGKLSDLEGTLTLLRKTKVLP